MMNVLAMLSLPSLRLLFLGGAAATLYIVGRMVMGVIPRRLDGSTLRAMLGLMPILVVGVVAVVMGRPQVGLHLPIAAATGAITFGIGSILLGRGGEPSGVRSWAFVLPAVALVMIGGFGGRLDLVVLALLVAFGVTALNAWLPDRFLARPAAVAVMTRGPAAAIASGTFGETVVTEQMAPPSLRDASSQPLVSGVVRQSADESRLFAMFIWILSGLLAVLAGWMAIRGLPALESMRRVPADALITIYLLAPAIVVPIVFELLPPCRPVGWTTSISTLTKFAVMCLCVALPAIVLISAESGVIRDWLKLGDPSSTTIAAVASQTATTMPTTAPTSTPATSNTLGGSAISSTQPSVAPTPALVFPNLPSLPLQSDLIVLAAAALLLLPVAGGWLKPGKLEALALFGCYVINLMLVLRAMMS